MSWKNTALIMLRTMLNDANCCSEDHTDSRLMELLITAAYINPIEINFKNDYTVSIENQSITPDPSTQEDGREFISFMVLKAACMTDLSNFRTAALLQGVSARCGPATITTSNYGAYLKELLKEGPCKSYDTLVERYNLSYDNAKIIRAVMSPFASNDFDPGSQLGQLGIGDYTNTHRKRGFY